MELSLLDLAVFAGANGFVVLFRMEKRRRGGATGEGARLVGRGGIGPTPGVILGGVLLPALPEVLRYVAGPLQAMTDGRLDSAILRQLLVALAMFIIMLMRPRGLWPAPDHGKSLTQKT